jgi:uncharacterized protein YndB with AHSA1/START domain
MERQGKQVITIENTVNAPVIKVWEYWTKPEHIVKWNTHLMIGIRHGQKDLKVGGNFSAVWRPKTEAWVLILEGVYDAVREHQYIEYTPAMGEK